MQVRILDLDGSLTQQSELVRRFRPAVFAARPWGPAIRLACGFGRFRRFERMLERLLPPPGGPPEVTLYGSGDFHHVSLALVRRTPGPVNLLVLDNHPDWMRGVPFLHCGTWLHHAARLPQVRHVFHVGGDVDFDNAYRPLAPWPLLHGGKVRVFPARRPFQRGRWSQIENEPLRRAADTPADEARVASVLGPFAAELARYPLYISVDRDVLVADESVVNWDSGHLTLAEAVCVVQQALRCAGGRLAGADMVGDWSPVHTRGLMRRLFHWTMHPPLRAEAADAARTNERANVLLLDALAAAAEEGARSGTSDHVKKAG
jgi:hypothetical protein